MDKNKLLILATVVILISAVGYMFLNLKSQIGPTDLTSQDLLNFEDEELGLSFKYPKYLTAQPLWESEGGETSSGPWRRINLSYKSNEVDEDFSLLSIEGKSHPLTKSAIEIGSATIDGNPAVIYGIPNTCQSVPGFVVVINKGGSYLQVSHLSKLESSEYIYNVETILKTLKFLPNDVDTENIIPNLYYPDPPVGLVCD